jgi:hypothetical protein
MCEQIVELCANLENARRRPLVYDLFRDHLYQSFPVWGWYRCLLIHVLTVQESVSHLTFLDEHDTAHF